MANRHDVPTSEIDRSVAASRDPRMSVVGEQCAITSDDMHFILEIAF